MNVSLIAIAKHGLVIARQRVKPFRFFLPFPRLVHRFALALALHTLRKAVISTRSNWDNSLQMIIVGIPKSASTTLAHHFRENLRDVENGGDFLYARDVAAIKGAVKEGHSPRVLHIGHQTPAVLTRVGLVSRLHLESIPSLAVQRPEPERIASAVSYLVSRSYMPKWWTEGMTRGFLRFFGRPNPDHHSTALVWGPEIHLAAAHSWFAPDDWAGPNTVISFSNFPQGVLNALALVVEDPKIDVGLHVNRTRISN